MNACPAAKPAPAIGTSQECLRAGTRGPCGGRRSLTQLDCTVEDGRSHQDGTPGSLAGAGHPARTGAASGGPAAPPPGPAFLALGARTGRRRRLVDLSAAAGDHAAPLALRPDAAG